MPWDTVFDYISPSNSVESVLFTTQEHRNGFFTIYHFTYSHHDIIMNICNINDINSLTYHIPLLRPNRSIIVISVFKNVHFDISLGVRQDWCLLIGEVSFSRVFTITHTHTHTLSLSLSLQLYK